MKKKNVRWRTLYLFINNYVVHFKVTSPLWYNTFMTAFFLILETFLKTHFLVRQQFLFRFFFYLLKRSITLSFHWCLQFWEDEKISGDQVRYIWWLRHDYGFVFRQKLMHKHRCVSWCVLMVPNQWLIFPQFCRFLTSR